ERHHDQHRGDELRCAESVFDFVFEERAGKAARDRGRDNQHRHFAVRGFRVTAEESETRTDQGDPFHTEVDEQRDEGAQMERDVESQARIRPTHEPGEKDEMSGTGYGKELGQALNGTKDNCLKNGHSLYVSALIRTYLSRVAAVCCLARKRP